MEDEKSQSVAIPKAALELEQKFWPLTELQKEIFVLMLKEQTPYNKTQLRVLYYGKLVIDHNNQESGKLAVSGFRKFETESKNSFLGFLFPKFKITNNQILEGTKEDLEKSNKRFEEDIKQLVKVLKDKPVAEIEKEFRKMQSSWKVWGERVTGLRVLELPSNSKFEAALENMKDQGLLELRIVSEPRSFIAYCIKSEILKAWHEFQPIMLKKKDLPKVSKQFWQI